MKKNNKQGSLKKRETSGPDVIGESKITHLWAWFFLCVSTFLAYSGSLNGTWALDDGLIGQFVSIENTLNLRLGYRKIAYLTFQFNKLIDPLNPFSFRLVNILIHLFNALLVYRIAFLTLRLPGWKDEYGRYAYAVSLMSAAVFALHPININAVTYIVQRMASLATMFVLLALLSYIFARTSGSVKKSAGFYAATAVFVVLGIFSKENGIMAIPLLLLYDFFFLYKDFKKDVVRVGIGIGAALLVLGVSAIVLNFQKQIFDLGSTLLRLNQPIPPAGWTAVDVYWTPLQHILTEFRVIARYLFLLLLPLPRFLVFDWWGFPLSEGLTAPLSTTFSLLAVAGIISLAVFTRRKLPFLSFGILWYFLALSLESFLAIGSDLYFEHRNYLPMTGLCIGVAGQAVVAMKDKFLGKKTLWSVVLALSLVLGFLTFQRNLAWKDSVTLWNDTVGKTDGNLRAIVALGNSFLKVSDLTTAKKYYEGAVKISASRKSTQYYDDSIYSLGMVDLFMGNLEEAKKVIDIMDKRIEGSQRLDILKGFYSSLSGDPGEAIKRYERILPSVSGIDRVIVFTLMGDAYSRKGSRENAIENYKNAVRIDPSFSAAYYGLSSVYMSVKDIEKASYFIEKTLALDPHNALALSQMADILLIKKEPPEKAREFAARAVANSPVFYQPYLTMGNVLVVMGREDAAEEYFRKAKEHGVQDYMIPFSKARSYFMRGEKEKVKTYLEEVLSYKDTPEDLKKTLSGSLSKM
jgi:tetratricopeptide (TPR) repeat protein